MRELALVLAGAADYEWLTVDGISHAIGLTGNEGAARILYTLIYALRQRLTLVDARNWIESSGSGLGYRRRPEWRVTVQR